MKIPDFSEPLPDLEVELAPRKYFSSFQIYPEVGAQPMWTIASCTAVTT